MEFEWIQTFLSVPQLADIISYVLVIAAYLSLYFVKKFVKRDNKNTTAKIESKISKLDKLQAKMENSDILHEKEREVWRTEKKQLQEEINTLKKVVRICSCNSKELVKCGVSNKIAKMIPVEFEEEVQNLNTEIIEKADLNNTSDTNMEDK